MNTNDIESIAKYIYNHCFDTNSDWWNNYCPYSEHHVKRAGKKFLKELNSLGIETYENIRCEQTDWYFKVSTDEDLYDVYIDWWNGYIEVNVTGFSNSFIVNADGLH